MTRFNRAAEGEQRPYLPKREYLAKKKEEQREYVANTYPKHLTDLVYLLKNNAEIRRFTGKRIIEDLVLRKVVTSDAKVFVKFNFSKFTIVVNGYGTDYSYKEVFFINALAQSFADFANAAQVVINNFMDEEGISETQEEAPTEGQKKSSK